MAMMIIEVRTFKNIKQTVFKRAIYIDVKQNSYTNIVEDTQCLQD
jgi:hypothetical protein